MWWITDLDQPLLVQWQQKTPPKAPGCFPEEWRRSISEASPAAGQHPRTASRSPHWQQILTPSVSSHTWHKLKYRTCNQTDRNSQQRLSWRSKQLPGHGLDDSRQAQRWFFSPPEGLTEVLQTDTYSAAVPAGLYDKSRPEVHLTVPVRRVDISVLLKVGEQKIHPGVVVPLRCQSHFGGVRQPRLN